MTAPSLSPSIPAPIRRDRLTWAAYLALAQFTFFLNIQGNIIPFLKDEFDLSYRVVTLHPAAVAAGLIVSGLFGERLTRRYGRPRSVMFGLAGMALGAVAITAAPHPVVSILGCFLMGAVGCLVLIVVPTLLADWHGANRSVAIGEANGVSYVASLTAAMAVGLFVAIGFGWRAALLLGVVLAGLLLLFLRGVPMPAPKEPATVETGGHGGRLPMAYWLYWLTIIAFVGVEQSVLVWATEFLVRVKDVPVASAAIAAGAFSLGMLVGRLSSAFVLTRITAARALYLSAIVTVPAFFLFWGAPSLLVAVVGLFAVGLGCALQYPLTLTKAIVTAGPFGELATARASLASGLSILIIPWAIGALADHVGLFTAISALPILIVAAVGFLFVGERLVRH
ncbi:sugar MFS transporter [Pleomorphomonas sp. JP5]|uniref:MFS transporter n=1 Tax=Pleomorphomonas sp. JP5 TaxID=2942998 RepID=UPI002042C6F9|nr:MFS transporter [Pleomorphomonas sp. JP5]MCM5556834.1 MFS transporter [Pleomorphomonas sp. JP5]